jgi:hypothetical protein
VEAVLAKRPRVSQCWGICDFAGISRVAVGNHRQAKIAEMLPS